MYAYDCNWSILSLIITKCIKNMEHFILYFSFCFYTVTLLQVRDFMWNRLHGRSVVTAWFTLYKNIWNKKYSESIYVWYIYNIRKNSQNTTEENVSV